MAVVINFPAEKGRAHSSPKDSRYDFLRDQCYRFAKQDLVNDDPRVTRIRALLAGATPAPVPGESEMLKLLRRIDRRLGKLERASAVESTMK